MVFIFQEPASVCKLRRLRGANLVKCYSTDLAGLVM